MQLSPKKERARALAPASVANVAVGFDILGFAIPVLGDIVEVEAIKSGVEIKSVTGTVSDLPMQAEKNTAGKALLEMIKGEDLKCGFAVKIEKGIPLGSGLGGSAASAVAAVVAANALLVNPLPKQKLFRYASAGESASGSIHGDNIAASLFGGLTLYLEKESSFVVENIPVPESLHCVLAHPDFILETKKAREILKKEVELKQHIRQSMYLSSFLVGCFKNDLNLLKGSIQDIIIEPQRAHLIPSFAQMKEAALKAGSIGFSISGAGPAVFALCDSQASARGVEEALRKVTQDLPHKVKIWNTKLDEKGARVI